jgi:hypothetical protein
MVLTAHLDAMVPLVITVTRDIRVTQVIKVPLATVVMSVIKVNEVLMLLQAALVLLVREEKKVH